MHVSMYVPFVEIMNDEFLQQLASCYVIFPFFVMGHQKYEHDTKLCLYYKLRFQNVEQAHNNLHLGVKFRYFCRGTLKT